MATPTLVLSVAATQSRYLSHSRVWLDRHRHVVVFRYQRRIGVVRILPSSFKSLWLFRGV